MAASVESIGECPALSGALLRDIETSLKTQGRRATSGSVWISHGVGTPLAAMRACTAPGPLQAREVQRGGQLSFRNIL